MSEKLVKVKMFKSVGPYMAGEVVEVSEEVAKQLCKVSQMFNGERLVDFVRAKMADQAEKEEKAPIDASSMTQAELAQAGKKNVVATPKDETFEARKEVIQKGDEEFKKKGGKKNGGLKPSAEEEAAAKGE